MKSKMGSGVEQKRRGDENRSLEKFHKNESKRNELSSQGAG